MISVALNPQRGASPGPVGCSPLLPAAAVLCLEPLALEPAAASAPAAAAPGWEGGGRGRVEEQRNTTLKPQIPTVGKMHLLHLTS